ncbi:MAG: hypothetical protein HQM04_09920 [Magnetococcales bacterium]|nr:hypothetical protein [Magnetococcales bacterium]MBF0115349.1 hypothetical protein [Magnetococcales bacterium]
MILEAIALDSHPPAPVSVHGLVVRDRAHPELAWKLSNREPIKYSFKEIADFARKRLVYLLPKPVTVKSDSKALFIRKDFQKLHAKLCQKKLHSPTLQKIHDERKNLIFLSTDTGIAIWREIVGNRLKKALVKHAKSLFFRYGRDDQTWNSFEDDAILAAWAVDISSRFYIDMIAMAGLSQAIRNDSGEIERIYRNYIANILPQMSYDEFFNRVVPSRRTPLTQSETHRRTQEQTTKHVRRTR